MESTMARDRLQRAGLRPRFRVAEPRLPEQHHSARRNPEAGDHGEPQLRAQLELDQGDTILRCVGECGEAVSEGGGGGDFSRYGGIRRRIT
jgi:hypothetical protein